LYSVRYIKICLKHYNLMFLIYFKEIFFKHQWEKLLVNNGFNQSRVFKHIIICLKVWLKYAINLPESMGTSEKAFIVIVSLSSVLMDCSILLVSGVSCQVSVFIWYFSLCSFPAFSTELKSLHNREGTIIVLSFQSCPVSCPERIQGSFGLVRCDSAGQA
jgi:hypothetical protein